MKCLNRKDLLLLITKVIEKISDPCHVKEDYQSFIRKKNTKSIKESKVITQQLKTFENPSDVNIKSVIIEHTKTSHKLSKTIRQAERVSQVGSNSSLYSDTKKSKIFGAKKK